MTTADFTHLHVHSHYSFLEATISVAELATQAAAHGLTRLALTDSHGLYGAVAFARACRRHDIQPLIGMTIAVSAPNGDVLEGAIYPGRLVLLAMGPAGYRSLCRLSTAVQGSKQREEIVRRGLDWELLKTNREGVICLSGGRRGWLARFLRSGNEAAAARFAAKLGGIFTDRAYLSLEWHTAADTAVNQALVALGSRFGLPAAAVQPIYTLAAADKARLRLLAAIDRNCPLADVPAQALADEGDTAVTTHWRSPADVAGIFTDFPEALMQTGEIAARCQPALPDSRPLWPALSLPEKQTPDEALAAQATAGLAARAVAAADGATYAQRLARELAAIAQHGFAPFFLLVADIVRFAREQAIPVSTRGSVANSLVAYALGITTVDPLVHDLLFERFLNPARTSLPDIDLDFCSRRRDEVLAYVRRTYGPDRVALVATVSTMQPKSAVRETAKAYGYDEAGIKRLAALVPSRWHPDPRRRDRKTLQDVVGEVDDPADKKVLAAAFAIVDQPHHLSIHPGGVVVTPGPLTDTVPVQMAPKGFLITQFDHRDVEEVGLPKLDLLGIRALTVLADTAVYINTHHDPDFRLETIPLDDPETAALLAAGDGIGIFQCESTGAQRTLRQLKAGSVRDLAVANAFFKPGPATGGMAEAFIRRYRREEAVAYLHPALESILAPTQGVLLFQEQILRVATEVAGLGWADADQLRRGMSKFEVETMSTIQARFETGCQRRSGLTAAEAQTLWTQVIAFAGYGFNQGHATAYADVSYRSAYLKAHYPAAFLWARLQDHGGFHHPVIYLVEARRLGLVVMPPHVNVSKRKVTLTEEWPVANSQWSMVNGEQLSVINPKSPILWLGLGQVRDLRRSAVKAIVAARRQRPFASVRDLLARVDLQPKEVTHLIQCGALDGLGASRAAMLAEAEEVARAGSAHQLAFDFAVATAVAPESPATRLAWEKRLLGWPVSVHPLDLLPADNGSHSPIAEVPAVSGRVAVRGVRLPGWTGSRGFFLDDGHDFVVVAPARGSHWRNPSTWRPIMVHGRYRTDAWGSGWLEADAISLLDDD